jgi:acyl carrier protein
MTETETLRSTIKRLIVERLFLQGLNPEDIGDDVAIGEELGLDSMDFLELAVGLEQTFDLQIVGKGLDPESLKSVNSLVEFVEKKLEEKQQGA